MIQVHPFGAYSHRQPLAYAPIRDACAGRIAVTDRMAQADIVLVSHSKDLAAHGAGLRRALGAGQRLVLLSEEPLWDTVWSDDPLSRRQVLETADGPLPYTVLNHHTSAIYDFDHIPYFLLTDRSFFIRYASWFARNGALSETGWRARFAQATLDVAFLAEYRDDPSFDVAYAAQGIYGLGARRTRIARACTTGRVLRSGAGWNALPRRQDLPDWHLEKFLDLDGRCRMISAIENTHQANYVTEKIFDAFAAGAAPLYIAEPTHRVHDLVPEGAFLNLAGLTPEAAAATIAGFAPDAAFFEAYRAAQARLAALFTVPAPMLAEFARLARALEVELGRVLAD